MKRLQIVPYQTNINFIGFRFITFALAALIAFASLFSMFYKGLNFGIDFKGGYILEVRMPKPEDPSVLRDQLSKLHIGDVMLQQAGSDRDFLIKLEASDVDIAKNKAYEQSTQEESAPVIDKVKKILGDGVDYRKIETVGPKVGQEMVENAVRAIGFALLAMLVYIALRFEWQFAICAIIALSHDCLAIMGLFSIFPLEFNETAIIAILITAGYSINDTIVIFDRIREGLRKYKKETLGDIINKSLNETLSRTTLTALTTLLSVFALFLFGGDVISKFSLPILVGIVIGSFSSICLAAPLLLYLKLDRKSSDKNQKGEPANTSSGSRQALPE